MMNIKRLAFLTSIGSGLEYYDFVVYGLLSPYLGRLFFPTASAWASLLQALSLFAMGYLARPIGGIVFGHIGDKFGRKKALLLSASLISLATFAIGMIPDYSRVGYWGTFCLIVFRLLQGLAFGAEMPGMLTFITEHAPPRDKGLYFGFVLSAVSLGGLLGSGIPFLLSHVLTDQRMLAYGWRIPFYLGGIWSIAIFIVRNRIAETPLFMAHEAQRLTWPLMALRQYPNEIISGISICLFPACLIVLGIALPGYVGRYGGYAPETVFLSVFVGALSSLFILPLFGRLSDILGSRRLLYWTAGIFMVVGYGFFSLLQCTALWVFFIVYNVIVAALANAYLQTLVTLFPVAIRFSGEGFCYNVVYSVAGFVPLLLGVWSTHHHLVVFLYGFFTLLALMTLWGCWRIKRIVSTVTDDSTLQGLFRTYLRTIMDISPYK